MTEASEQLIADHVALDRILKQLQTALRSGDLESAHANLDLFWARLAVHIRAEHLHLFPTVLSRVANEAQTVAQLREDHEFFMHELAQAVETMRRLLTETDQSVIKAGLDSITNTILQVEQRLIRHNEVEENQIYRLASLALSSDEQEKLVKQITSEFQKRPSRFTSAIWSNSDDLSSL